MGTIKRTREHEPAAHAAAFRVLKFLALNKEGPKSAYEIEIGIKVRPENGTKPRVKRQLHTPTVDGALSLLKRTGLVNVAQRPRVYEITGQGIVALLQGHPDLVDLSKDDVKDLARIQEWFLPLIFGKWSYFSGRGVEDFAYMLLLRAARTLGTTGTIETGGPTQPGRSWQGPGKGYFAIGYDFRQSLVMTGFASLHSSVIGYPNAADIELFEILGNQDECVLRHDIYAAMFLLGWFHLTSRSIREDTAKTYKDWLDVVRNDKELMAAAERESERLSGERDEYSRFWKTCFGHLRDTKLPKACAMGYFTRRFGDNGRFPSELHYYWRRSRARALEEGRVLPSLEKAAEELVLQLKARPED